MPTVHNSQWLSRQEQFYLSRRPTRPGEREGVGYIRVSGDKQEDNTSLKRQLEDLLAEAEKRNINIRELCGDVFTGTVYRERTGLTLARKLYKQANITAFAIRTFDRLARNQTHFCVLLEEMQRHKVELVCAEGELDNSPMGQFSRMVLASFAEMEREKILDRTVTGKRDMAVKEQRLIPGSKPLYGYRWDNEKNKSKYLINPEEAKVVQECFRLYVEGISLRKIVQHLIAKNVPPPRKAWAVSYLATMVRNPFYIGEARAYRYNHTLTMKLEHRNYEIRPIEEQVLLPEGTVPAIVDKETFDMAQQRLQSNIEDSQRNNRIPNTALLRSGFLKCGVCGRTMVTRHMKHPSGKVYHLYQCTGVADPLKPCKGGRIMVDKLDTIVWEYIVVLSHDLELIRQAVTFALGEDGSIGEIKALEGSITNWEQIRDAYQEDLRQTTLRSARNLILAELEKAEIQLETLREEKNLVLTGKRDYELVKAQYNKILDWCDQVSRRTDDLTLDERRQFLRALGVTVILYPKNHDGPRQEIRASLPELASATLGFARIAKG